MIFHWKSFIFHFFTKPRFSDAYVSRELLGRIKWYFRRIIGVCGANYVHVRSRKLSKEYELQPHLWTSLLRIFHFAVHFPKISLNFAYNFSNFQNFHLNFFANFKFSNFTQYKNISYLLSFILRFSNILITINISEKKFMDFRKKRFYDFIDLEWLIFIMKTSKKLGFNKKKCFFGMLVNFNEKNVFTVRAVFWVEKTIFKLDYFMKIKKNQWKSMKINENQWKLKIQQTCIVSVKYFMEFDEN